MAYIDLDKINRLRPKLTAKYPLSFANGISVAINEINRLPNADVVPKSEVEKWKAEAEQCYSDTAIMREYTINQIFTDIEEVRGEFLEGKITGADLVVKLFLLKKKYTEGET